MGVIYVQEKTVKPSELPRAGCKYGRLVQRGTSSVGLMIFRKKWSLEKNYPKQFRRNRYDDTWNSHS